MAHDRKTFPAATEKNTSNCEARGDKTNVTQTTDTANLHLVTKWQFGPLEPVPLA